MAAPIFGDKKSIENRDSKRSKKTPLYWRYFSSCCHAQVKSKCDWERPKDGYPGVTLINTCLKCGGECMRLEEPVY